MPYRNMRFQFDLCVCGDYRKDHKNEIGECLLCKHDKVKCSMFVLANEENAIANMMTRDIQYKKKLINRGIVTRDRGRKKKLKPAVVHVKYWCRLCRKAEFDTEDQRKYHERFCGLDDPKFDMLFSKILGVLIDEIGPTNGKQMVKLSNNLVEFLREISDIVNARPE